MKRKLLVASLLLLSSIFAVAEDGLKIKHVLLVSVDGLHALDVANYVAKNPKSALAELSRRCTTFTNARTPANTDSFPGLLALVTGGSPVSHGFFYDVGYDRSLFDPTNTACTGTPGNLITYDESIDVYDAANVSLDVIDPTKLPRGKDANGNCVAIYPHAALRTNTIFEVVRAAGGHTAWADKHPAYDLVNGNSGNGVEDLYTPEITSVGGPDATASVVCTAVLAYGLQKTDAALASMVQALKDQGIFDSTLFVVTAKHGQSPINPVKVNKPGHLADLVAALPDGGTNPAAIALVNAGNCSTGPCGAVSNDDVALIWLQDQSQTASVAAYLNANANALFIEDVMAGNELKLRFNNPATDSRTPDIIVQPVYGAFYSTSKKKNAEHGGFSYSDTNVGLIVSGPGFRGGVIKTPVATSQVAPTILKALGLNPSALKSVRVEKTAALPGLGQ